MRFDKQKVRTFERRLADFFQKTGREHLPWRRKSISAYEVWVSEIMLQQTQVSRVIGYYTRFLERFPTVEKLAEASWEEFLPYYQGLGYYARGRNMLLAAQAVMKEHDGSFPRGAASLRKLPGVGPYTAAAIQSFAYGMPAISWDTNVRRVLGRVFFGAKNQVQGHEAELEALLRMERKELNAALMDFGSAICTARPKCAACMLRPHCEYDRTEGKQESVTRNQESRIHPVKSAKRYLTKQIFHRVKNPERAAKQSEPIDWKEAEAWVFLHEQHRRYFSALKTRYQPFVLPAGYNTRAGIKQWFLERHGLALAVRPPHRKLLFHGKPVIWVNAQVLLGEPQFKVFSKSDAMRYTQVQEAKIQNSKVIIAR